MLRGAARRCRGLGDGAARHGKASPRAPAKLAAPRYPCARLLGAAFLEQCAHTRRFWQLTKQNQMTPVILYLHYPVCILQARAPHHFA